MQGSGQQHRVTHHIAEIDLSTKEQKGLNEFIREGLHNIRKHAIEANHIRISLEALELGWKCFISDNGQGFTGNPFLKEGSYGLKFCNDCWNWDGIWI